jgi:hypothetical protein
MLTRLDPALPAPLFRKLAARVRALGQTRLRQTYQTTFWFPLDEAPASVIEEAVLLLRPHVPGRFVGVEWWLSRMRTSNVQVDFHRDCDEQLLRQGGPEVFPTRGSVLFLNQCRGGLLAVTEAPPNPANPACAPDALDFDLVRPAPNRYVTFAGHLTHGVLDARNQVPGARLPREPGLRLAVAINYWDHRPTGVPRFRETKLYRPLALTPARRGLGIQARRQVGR